MTTFKKLNLGWNAEPNAPTPRVAVLGVEVFLCFQMSPHTEIRFSDDDIGELCFQNSCHYRLGATNDEGWYMGQCRFSKMAPAWGEFYEVGGDLLLDRCINDWVDVGPEKPNQKHFLFYLRDEQFEIKAASWSFKVIGQTQPIRYSIP